MRGCRLAAALLAALIVAAGCSGEEEPRDLGIGTDAPPATTESAKPSPSPSPTESPSSTVTLSPAQQAAFDAAGDVYREFEAVLNEVYERGLLDDYATERLLGVAAEPVVGDVEGSLMQLEDSGYSIRGDREIVWIHPAEVNIDVDPAEVRLMPVSTSAAWWALAPMESGRLRTDELSPVTCCTGRATVGWSRSGFLLAGRSRHADSCPCRCR